MEFFDAVLARRSVRRYTKTAVPAEVITRALDAALLAPNSSNMQPWEFYWVRSAEKKSAMVKACLSQPAAATAQELIAVVARADTWRRNSKIMIGQLAQNPNAPRSVHDYYARVVPLAYLQGWFNILGIMKWLAMSAIGLFRPVPRGPFTQGEVFTVVSKSAALACENFMLAIAAQGFGCCPMEGYDEKRVKKILGLGRGARMVMVISVGETDPAGVYGERIRFDKGLFVFEV